MAVVALCALCASVVIPAQLSVLKLPPPADDKFPMLWIEKRMVLLVTFLGLGLFQTWVGRGIDKISLQPFWKTALLMAYVVFSYTVAAEFVTPYVQRVIKGLHGTLKPSRGALAGIATALALLAVLYWGYYRTHYPSG